MTKLFSALILTLLVLIALPTRALAAPKPAAPKPTTATDYIGYDVSYPQCGKRLPSNHYFGIVGVNGGTAVKANPCLADQLVWAISARTGSNQSKKQLYVNTANPGQLIDQITTWPTSPYDSNGNLPANPYGNTCTGANDTACSWLYGWNRSIYTEGVFKAAAVSKNLDTATANYLWWLDVETMNTWQAGDNDALIRNTAAIEGFGAYYQSKGARVGLYSTREQWTTITGNNIRLDSNLNGLPNWRPSGASLSNAKTNCSVPPLTLGGSIVLTQYVVKNLDHNYSCTQ